MPRTLHPDHADAKNGRRLTVGSRTDELWEELVEGGFGFSAAASVRRCRFRPVTTVTAQTATQADVAQVTCTAQGFDGPQGGTGSVTILTQLKPTP